MRFRVGVRWLLLIGLLCQFAADGWAQDYPVKAVRYLVPGSAGSGADTIGRMLAAGLTQAFRQQVIVDNRPGAGGNIGAEVASKAPADGYTLFQITMTHATNASLYRNLSYDLVRDFDPVTQLASSPYVVVVHPSLPAKSMSDLVHLAKARPGAINYASGGTGTPTFLAGELFKGITGVNMLHVPYRGGGEAVTALITGETSVLFGPLATTLPHIRQGRLRALAVTSSRRLPLLPEYPTVAESGFPGYEAGNWYGLVVPVKTPGATIALIRGAAVSVLRNPDTGKRMNDLGFFVVGDLPEQFAAHIKSQIETIGKIIRTLRLTAD